MVFLGCANATGRFPRFQKTVSSGEGKAGLLFFTRFVDEEVRIESVFCRKVTRKES